jgi:hypothetical protein
MIITLIKTEILAVRACVLYNKWVDPEEEKWKGKRTIDFMLYMLCY